MIKRGLLILVLFSLSCSRSPDLLEKVPDPPPGPPRYSKGFKFDLSTSEKGAVDVDIIWMIDNSSSMNSHQQSVRDNSAIFIRQFTSSTSLHWRMGLLSSTLEEPPFMGFQKVVDWQSADPVGEFTTAVNSLATPLGTDRDCCEQTFGPVLKATQDFPQFLRPGAFVVVIAVSDEVEQSRYSVDQFLQGMDQRISGGWAGRFTFFGIVTPSLAVPGSHYGDVITRTGGKIYDLFSGNFGTLMANLGQDLVARTMSVNPVILLDQRPKPDTITVEYRGRPLRAGSRAKGGEWSYDPVFNTITIYDPKIINPSFLDVQVSFVLEDTSI